MLLALAFRSSSSSKCLSFEWLHLGSEIRDPFENSVSTGPEDARASHKPGQQQYLTYVS
jgi:hypothetical protein